MRTRRTGTNPWAFGLLVASACGPTLSMQGEETGAGSSSGGMAATTGGTTGGSPTTGVVGPGTTGGSSGAASTSSEGTTEGQTFIVETTSSSEMNECDNWAQDCPEGQKCSAYAQGGGTSWDSLKCVPVMEDPAQPGEPCFVVGNGVSGFDNCDFGSYCWDTNAEDVGTCVALCTGSPEASMCPSGFTCAIYSTGVLNLCLDGCDPLLQDCAMEDDVCIGSPNGNGFLCVLDASGEEGQAHDPCEYANSCDPGLICLDATAAVECDANASGCCEPFCDLTKPNTCPGQGQVCNPYYEEGTAPTGEENIGTCAVPR